MRTREINYCVYICSNVQGTYLDDRAVSKGVRVGHANLDNVRSDPVQLQQGLLRVLQVGIAGADEGDQGNPGVESQAR